VATLFCLLVFGITQFGQALNTANDETHLADMAARYAAVNYNPSTSGQSFVAWVKAQGGTSFSKNGSVNICFPNGTSNVGDPVEVVTQSSAFSLQPLTALFAVAKRAGLPTPITIQGKAVMRLEASPSVYSATGPCP
jgi:Flp pilus assembly protein TadG